MRVRPSPRVEGAARVLWAHVHIQQGLTHAVLLLRRLSRTRIRLKDQRSEFGYLEDRWQLTRFVVPPSDILTYL